MVYVPILILTLIGVIVGTLQWRKARRFDGLKRRLALAVTACTYITADCGLLVIAMQGINMPGPGPVLALSILLAIAFWTASLIWAGPAEPEDRWVFLVTVGLVLTLMVLGLVSALTALPR